MSLAHKLYNIGKLVSKEEIKKIIEFEWELLSILLIESSTSWYALNMASEYFSAFFSLYNG